jgi:hypothetical protein
MTFLARFERSFLFGMTRALAMFFIFSTLVALIISGLIVGFNQIGGDDVKVAPQEVIDILKPTLPAETTQPDTKPSTINQPQTSRLPAGLKLPFILQKYFSDPSNLLKLTDWLDDVPKNHQQIFLDEMASAVTQAEKEHIDPYEAINTYRKLKLEKLEAEKIAETEKRQTMLWYAGAVGSGIIIIALFSLILVLLAIERNTRRINE